MIKYTANLGLMLITAQLIKLEAGLCIWMLDNCFYLFVFI